MTKKARLRSLVSLAALLALALAGCKKKESEAPAPKAGDGSAAPKTAEGSGSDTSPGSAAAGSAVNGSAASAGSGSGSATPEAAKPSTDKNVIEVAKAAGKFTTLLKAIDAAGLTNTLIGAGPFTVFAPTDDAFAKIPAKDLDALLADKAKLTALLQYHVVGGNLSSKDLATQKAVKSVQGADLPVDTSSGTKIGGATVVTPDLAASNGVVHVIDAVLSLPK